MQAPNEQNEQPVANNNNNRRQQQSRNRQFTFIIMLYLMITLVTHMSRTPSNTIKDIIRKKMESTSTQKVPFQVFTAMTNLQVYEGNWSSKAGSYAQYLTETQGRMKMACQVRRQINSILLYHFGFKIYNGQYADEGTINFEIRVNSSDLIIIEDNDQEQQLKTVSLQLKNSSTSLAFARYSYQRLLTGSSYNISLLDYFQVNFTVLEGRQVFFTFDLKVQNPMQAKKIEQIRDQRYAAYHSQKLNLNQTQISQEKKKDQKAQTPQTKKDQVQQKQKGKDKDKDKKQPQQKATEQILPQKADLNDGNKNEQKKQVKQQKKQIQIIFQSSIANKQQKRQSETDIPINLEPLKQQPTAEDNQQIQSPFDYNIQMSVKHELDSLIPTVTFAAVMFFISYSEFSSIIEINRQMIQGTRDAGHFSFYTWLIAMGWDIIFSFCCFSQAFSSTQTGIILFIMPAFLFALIFINMEPKIMIFTYRAQTSNNLDFRQLLCRFNLYNYAVMFLTFGIILLTNFNNFLPISLCLIFIPQIYLNGINGQRPEISDPYYSKFLLSRFIVIFYLRGFPWNIYDLKPDYLLCLTCATLLLFQITILWVQKAFGPKTVIPNFLLPPVYNYNCDQQLQNIEQAGEVSECAICLIPLTLIVDQSQNDLGYEVPYKIMKTPCNHKYHGICLVKWMKIKMECPQCRTRLPPYQ